MLSNLISKLQNQITENLFTYSAVIVDNDANQTAAQIVKDWQTKSSIQIDYYCEPEQNIAVARNKALANAKGNFIAFIDDDEFPDNTWLINLIKTLQQNKCSGVLGPVKPFFDHEPPAWIIKSKICERPSFTTGTFLKNYSETRTGNVLLSQSILDSLEKPFNPNFGRTGGEDVDFFKRKMSSGYTFVWCDEAPVYEVVPPARFRKKYYIKRALLRGAVNADKSTILSTDALKSAVAVIAYTACLPFFLLFGQHLFMKYLIKDCDHAGKVLGLLGFRIVEKR